MEVQQGQCLCILNLKITIVVIWAVENKMDIYIKEWFLLANGITFILNKILFNMLKIFKKNHMIQPKK